MAREPRSKQAEAGGRSLSATVGGPLQTPGGFSEQPDPGAKPGFQSLIPRLGIQAVRLCGPNAWGSRSLSVVAIVPGPSQTLNTSASGPNSLRTWRQAPQGAVGVWVGV